jgi:hypothetical protein
VPSFISNFSRGNLFLGQVALTTVGLLIAYGAFVQAIQPNVVISYDAGLRNRIIAERYADSARPKVVLVGSSLAARLSPEVIGPKLSPDIFDLAMLGQNSATGLDVVLAKREKPNMVLVEMNVLEHPYDPDFAEEVFREPWRSLRRDVPIFRLENRPFDLAIVGFEKIGKAALNSLGLHSDEPVYSPSSNERTPGARSPTMSEAFRKKVERALNRLASQVEQLQQGGVRVVFLRLPVDQTLASTRPELYKMSKAAERFPLGKYEWLDMQTKGPYETLDGSHLTPRSARDVAETLNKNVNGK